MRYKIVYSEKAKQDYIDLFKCIASDYGVPQTAFKYMQGILDTIRSLETMPAAYPIKANMLLQFGQEARRVNYKKMAIVYAIHNDVVFIHRIIAASMIT